jgi:hypothetical protein
MVSDTELNPTQQEAEPEQSDAQSPPTDVEKGQKDAEIVMNISYEADQMDETDKAPPADTATTRPIKSMISHSRQAPPQVYAFVLTMLSGSTKFMISQMRS